MHYGLWVDGKPISLSLEIKLSQIANISTAFMRQEPMFIDTTNSPLSYSRVVEEEYVIRFVEVRTMDIVEDTTSSNFLDANSRATYVRFITIGQMLLMH